VSVKQQLLVPTIGSLTYAQKVINLIGSSDIVGYWPLTETSGSTAVNANAPGSGDGTYNGCTLGDATNPNGEPAPLFDGVNDYISFTGANLTYISDRWKAGNTGEDGSLYYLAKAVSGMWTNGIKNTVIASNPSGSTQFGDLAPHDVNNTLQVSHRGSDWITENFNRTMTGVTSWFHAGADWLWSSTTLRAFLDGAQLGADQTALHQWPNTAGISEMNIGARTNGPTMIWDGWISHILITSRRLTSSELTELFSILGSPVAS